MLLNVIIHCVTNIAKMSSRFYCLYPEHHCFAVFRAPESRPDHHAYEASCWNDIRD